MQLWVGLLNKIGNEIAGVQIPDLPAHPWDDAGRIIELCVDYLKGNGWERDELISMF